MALLLAALALLAATAPAAATAAPVVTLEVTPDAQDVRLGQRSPLAGRATDAGVALPGREVRLEVRRHPFKGGWVSRATRRTDADGRFSFAPALDRNHDVRARLVASAGDPAYAPQGDVLSPVARVFVLPAFTLRFRSKGEGRIRITQTYRVPRDVRLRARTRFYVGPCELRRGRCRTARAPVRARARTKRVRAGRYRAAATVRIPARYEGRFQYASCFTYSRGSGMGDPAIACPRAERLP